MVLYDQVRIGSKFCNNSFYNFKNFRALSSLFRFSRNARHLEHSGLFTVKDFTNIEVVIVEKHENVTLRGSNLFFLLF